MHLSSTSSHLGNVQCYGYKHEGKPLTADEVMALINHLPDDRPRYVEITVTPYPMKNCDLEIRGEQNMSIEASDNEDQKTTAVILQWPGSGKLRIRIAFDGAECRATYMNKELQRNPSVAGHRFRFTLPITN